MNKIQEAVNIIKKFHPAFHVQKTDIEEIVFLFEYKMNKKTVGSEKIKNAVEKAVKQQDFPKAVKYQDGMLFVLKAETVKEVKQEIIEEKEAVVEETVNEEIALEDAPKKRTRKKKETETETESE
jgi:non-homologous end joining protein Ku